MEGKSNTAIQHDLVITRTLKASQLTVWKMLTEKEHLAKWWGPKEASIEVKTFDFRPGGIFHYSMDMPGGMKMWGLFRYREIFPIEKMVFVNAFADADGNAIRAPFFEGKWPLEVLNELTLASEGAVTTLTLRGGPINCTPEETSLFVGNTASMQQGFKGTFDQLDAYLETL